MLNYRIKLHGLKMIESITLRGHTNTVNALIALPNGYLASGSDDWLIKIWDPNDGIEIKNIIWASNSYTIIIFFGCIIKQFFSKWFT